MSSSAALPPIAKLEETRVRTQPFPDDREQQWARRAAHFMPKLPPGQVVSVRNNRDRRRGHPLYRSPAAGMFF
jgi:hypothetical protein